MGNILRLESKNASLDTLTVTVQSLVVSGKQMTLAVFRQLPYVEIQSDSGLISDEFRLWGIVRYKIGDDDTWVVSERNGILFRCAVNLGFQPYYDHSFSSYIDQIERDLKEEMRKHNIMCESHDKYSRKIPLNKHDEWKAEHNENFYENKISYLEEMMLKSSIKIQKMVDEISYSKSQLEEKNKRRTNWKNEIDSKLKFLPQLFIAV